MAVLSPITMVDSESKIEERGSPLKSTLTSGSSVYPRMPTIGPLSEAALKAALIATEDRKFYTHSGVDLKGIARAIVKDIWAGEFIEGASTITQQLAKTLFLTPRKTLVRKIKEAILAFQLERRYTKEEILELYLNQVYFGSGAYGVQSASKIFFGKTVILDRCLHKLHLLRTQSFY